jgi:hypothetical protein
MRRRTKQEKATKHTRRTKAHNDEAAASSAAEENGGHDARAGAHPDEYGAGSQVLYWVSYRLSYGVVFPLAVLARLIPKENPIVYGLVDGAMAARDSVFGPQDEALESSEHEGTHALEAETA